MTDQEMINIIQRCRENGVGDKEIRSILAIGTAKYQLLRQQTHIYVNCIVCGKLHEVKTFRHKVCNDSECTKEFRNDYNRKYRKYLKTLPDKTQQISSVFLPEERQFSQTTDMEIVINDFEGKDPRFIAKLYNWPVQKIVDRLAQLKQSGSYGRILKAWSIRCPELYKRAFKKRNETA